MNSTVIEYVAYAFGLMGVFASAAIEFGGVNLGISSMTAGVCGIVPMVALLALSIVFRTPNY